jgi:O-antigen ligase
LTPRPYYSSRQHLGSFLATLLIAAMPITMLTGLAGASTVFYLLAAVSALICVSRAGGYQAVLSDWKDYRGLAAALFVSLLVITIAAMRGSIRIDNEIERALRLSIGTFLILGACLSLIPQWLRQATWGLVIATWVATGYTLWYALPTFRRPLEVPQHNAVSYGNLLLMMAVLATFSIGWSLTRFRKTEIAFKVLTMAVGLLGFITTQTRGGWLVVPFFIVIGWVLTTGKTSLRKLFMPVLVAIIVSGAVAASSPILRQRMHQMVTQTAECLTNPLAISSECGRLQLWHASWLMFKDNPLFGNGTIQVFGAKLESYWRQGIVSDFVYRQGFGEPHNDMLFSMASHGLLGLTALLLMYATPIWIFARRLRAGVSQPARVAAAMGLALCLGFFVFGWTELMLRSIRTIGFYAMTIAWLLALSDEKFIGRHDR